MIEEEVRELYINQGMNLKEVADQLNVNMTMLISFVTSHGLSKGDISRREEKLQEYRNRVKKYNSCAKGE